MKTNCWLILGVMLATSAVAQETSNTGATAPAGTAPAAASTEAPKPVKHKHHTTHANTAPLVEPTVTLNPGPAQVTVKVLTARGQAGLKGEVVGHLEEGDTVTVISQYTYPGGAGTVPPLWLGHTGREGIIRWLSHKCLRLFPGRKP